MTILELAAWGMSQVVLLSRLVYFIYIPADGLPENELAKTNRAARAIAGFFGLVASALLVVGFSATDSPMTAGLAAGFGALIMVVLLWSLVVWYFRRYWKRVAAENYPNEKSSVYWAGNITTEVNCALAFARNTA